MPIWNAAMDNDPAPSWRTYAWGVLAALTCPYHLPLLAILLAGTSAGAVVSEHWGIALFLLSLLFLLALNRAMRAWRRRS